MWRACRRCRNIGGEFLATGSWSTSTKSDLLKASKGITHWNWGRSRLKAHTPFHPVNLWVAIPQERHAQYEWAFGIQNGELEAVCHTPKIHRHMQVLTGVQVGRVSQLYPGTWSLLCHKATVFDNRSGHEVMRCPRVEQK